MCLDSLGFFILPKFLSVALLLCENMRPWVRFLGGQCNFFSNKTGQGGRFTQREFLFDVFFKLLIDICSSY